MDFSSVVESCPRMWGSQTAAGIREASIEIPVLDFKIEGKFGLMVGVGM